MQSHADDKLGSSDPSADLIKISRPWQHMNAILMSHRLRHHFVDLSISPSTRGIFLKRNEDDVDSSALNQFIQSTRQGPNSRSSQGIAPKYIRIVAQADNDVPLTRICLGQDATALNQ